MNRSGVVTYRACFRCQSLMSLVSLGLIVGACGMEESASPGNVGLPRSYRAVSAERYSTFSADVSVETELVKGPSRATSVLRSYRVEAARRSDGLWQTTLLLPPRQLPFPAGQAVASEHDVARIEFDPSTDTPRIFTRAGARIVIPEPASAATIQSRLGPTGASFTRQIQASTPTGRSGSGNWLRGFLAASDGGVALRAALTSQFGSPSRRDGQTTYSRNRLATQPWKLCWTLERAR
jgi:hypothetical protein